MRKVLLGISGVLLFLMSLIPPWQVEHYNRLERAASEVVRGTSGPRSQYTSEVIMYRPAWSATEWDEGEGRHEYDGRIHFVQLLLQIIALLGITGIALYAIDREG